MNSVYGSESIGGTKDCSTFVLKSKEVTYHLQEKLFFLEIWFGSSKDQFQQKANTHTFRFHISDSLIFSFPFFLLSSYFLKINVSFNYDVNLSRHDNIK